MYLQNNLTTSCYKAHIGTKNPLAYSISRSLSTYKERWPEITAHDRHIKKLAPSWDLLNAYRQGRSTEEEYTKRYINEMIEIWGHPNRIVTYLSQFPNESILLCYELPGVFCHRRVLADWIKQETDVIIPEWMSETDRKKSEIARKQQVLVDDLIGL